MTKEVIIDADNLLALLNNVETIIYAANNASGYCKCGLKMVGHPKGDHVIQDQGDLNAERVRERVLQLIGELTDA